MKDSLHYSFVVGMTLYAIFWAYLLFITWRDRRKDMKVNRRRNPKEY